MLMRQWYPRADAIVAVSSGVAGDLGDFADVPRQRITTIYNGIDIDRVLALSSAPVEDPWFAAGSPPVILAVGRLDPQKDYPTLLKAFAIVRASFEARLLILGEGAERQRLQALVENLGNGRDVRMPGAEANPYRYMGRARLLVLSSAWEGLPTVMLEALTCGCPIVSTNCSSGPGEMLDRGVFGELVPPGDAQALAAAMLRALASPFDRAQLRTRGRMFSGPATSRQLCRAVRTDFRTAARGLSGRSRGRARARGASGEARTPPSVLPPRRQGCLRPATFGGGLDQRLTANRFGQPERHPVGDEPAKAPGETPGRHPPRS